MGLIGQLIAFVRGDVDGAPVTEATLDPGGGANLTAQHFACPGDDSQPLAGDSAATTDGAATGEQAAVGYIDGANAGVAGAGEKRIYARTPSGEVCAEVWLKASGEVLIRSIQSEVRPGVVIRLAPNGIVHLGEENAAAELARADRVDAELARIWNLLTTWPFTPNDGGAALQTQAITDSAMVQSTASDLVRGT